MANLFLLPTHIAALQELIAAHLPSEEVWAWGSRVNGTAHETSDLDLVVRHPADLSIRQTSAFWELKAALRESNLPLLIDLSDWATLPADFRNSISKKHSVIYAPEVLAFET